MIEIEVKARCGPDVLDTIRALGAVYLATENHHDIYFNSAHRDFRKTDEALRIRIKEGGAWLTYKGPKLDAVTKSREEVTVKLDDAVAMEKIFASLGFVHAADVKKHRDKYALGDVILALDEVEGLGAFLEVEAVGNEDWETKREEVLRVVAHLCTGNLIRQSYLEMLEEASSDHNDPI
jgi:adenylate cyclase, class 2